MDIKQVATVLLLGRMISTFFMSLVIMRQIYLFKLKIDADIRTFRKVLFVLSIVVLAGNIIPVVLDVGTIISANGLNREDTPSAIGVAYAFSNCITAIMSSILIWTMYRLAAKTALTVEYDKEVALSKKS